MRFLNNTMDKKDLFKGISGHSESKVFIEWAASVLTILFFLLVTVGSYVKIKTVLVIVYSLIAAVLVLFALKQSIRDFLSSPLLYLWMAYCLVGLLSTVLFSKEKDFYILISEVSFTWILFVLTRFQESSRFFVLFRIFVALLVFAAIFQEITGIYVFAFLKEKTVFAVTDNEHGILSIFEYRHYFGCFLLLAFFSLFWFPEKQKWLTAFYGGLFFVALVLTYTRSIWIAAMVGLILGLIRWVAVRHALGKGRDKSSWNKPGIRTWITLCAVAITLAILALIFREEIVLVIQRVIGRFTVLNPNQGSWFNRMFTIVNGPKYVFENWQKYLFIGAGSGSALEWLKNAEGARFRSAIDCQYVHTFIENGLIGLLLLLGMIGYSLVRFFKSKDRKEVLFSLVFVMIAVSFFFYEVIVVNSSVYALWVFVLVSLCHSPKAKSSIESGGTHAPGGIVEG